MPPHNLPFHFYQAPLEQEPFKATSGTVVVDRMLGVIPVDTTAGAAAVTLSAPTKAGIIGAVVLDKDNGDLTLTVTNGYNADADTDIIFDDAGDFVVFYSIDVDGTKYWRVLKQGGTDAATEDFAVDQLTATTFTLNGLSLALSSAMTPGVGWVAGITTPVTYNIFRTGGLIKTEIFIDMTGLNGTSAAGDIIGDDGDVEYCHFGQITAALNGTLVGGKISCFETPAGGNPDVDFWSCIEDDGQNDEGLAGSMTGEVQHLNHGAWSAGEEAVLTTVPVADRYLYLAAGANTDADFSAGMFLIELWGVA